jgi:hypothetical protein
MTRVRLFGGPYDGMHLETDLELKAELKMPLYDDFRAAMDGAYVPRGGVGQVEIRSEGCVLYTRDKSGVYVFASETRNDDP